jgi:DNA-binding beta-propeller fold protein YncE
MKLQNASRISAVLIIYCATFLALVSSGSSAASAAPSVPAPEKPDSSFTLFESGQVRPLAISHDGRLLFAANTPANRLEIFATQHLDLSDEPKALKHVASVPVGLEPVAIAIRSHKEVWVVNHLSDSVSVVDISDLRAARVVRTLLVGDEPRDIVFAGPNRERAFITTAHRGQNSPNGPQLTTPGVGRADVWVFDADNLDERSVGGKPLTIITLFCDTPRALAVTPDGRTVYAAAFHSGDRTTTISAGSIDPLDLPGPRTNFEGIPAPPVGLIVKFRRSPVDGAMHWLDETNRIWDDKVRLSLPDRDVFAIDAMADPPAQKPGRSGFYTGVGTILFNMVVNPVNGAIYVSNTDAQNDKRFEGPGIFAGHTVRGHLAESRITVLQGSRVLARHLNKHIDYSHCCAPTPNEESVKSLAFPTGMAVSHDGRKLYVAAFGSSKVGIFDTDELEDNRFVPDEANQITVSGGGPSGLALTRGGDLLYVLTRFDNSISVIELATRREIAHIPMFNPEPASIVRGRRFLYDASLTSSHGDSACASCHVFGDFDSLAWDLGNPDNTLLNDPGPFELLVTPAPQPFHPMKGPMTTQSLRGMDNHGPMHWRGDRTGGNDAASFQPDSGTFDEQAGFKKFNVAFTGLLGRSEELTSEEMQEFTDFVLQITYPPNPIRNLDNSLTPDQQAGRDFFVGKSTGGLPADGVKTCNGCHMLDPNGNREFGVAHPGFFGTDGQSAFSGESQLFKIPHFRNLYQKVGMFGMSPFPIAFPFDPDPPTGPQVRGFGFTHDGSVDTVFRFHGATAFTKSLPGPGNPMPNPGGIPVGPEGDALRRQIEAFLLAFDSNLAPIVGQQITLNHSNAAVVGERIDLFEARAAAQECDLVVQGRIAGRATTLLFDPVRAKFKLSGRSGDLSDLEVRSLARSKDGELTFTCVPPGSGARIAASN